MFAAHCRSRRDRRCLIPGDEVGGLGPRWKGCKVAGAQEAIRIEAHEERAVGPVRNEIRVEPAIADDFTAIRARARRRSRASPEAIDRRALRTHSPRVNDDKPRASCWSRAGRCRMIQPSGARIVAPEHDATGIVKIRRGDRTSKRVGVREIFVPVTDLVP